MASWQTWMKGGSLLGGSYPYSTSSMWLVLALPSSVPLCPTAWGKKNTHTHKNLHFERICLSAIFSKHLIFYQANCTYLLARSRDTVMTCKAPLWLLSCLRESGRGTEPLRFILPWPKLLATSCFYLAREPPGTLLFGLDSCSPLAIAQELSSASQRS